MLQPAQNPSNSQNNSPNNYTYTPPKTISSPTEQATIGRSVVIKGDITGGEALFIDGRVEGTIHFAEHRVTIGRNGTVEANINAREIVIMGTVKGNIQCTDRLDIRSEGRLTGDVVTQRISVEDGAVMKGSVQVRAADEKHEAKSDAKHEAKKAQSSEPAKPTVTEQPKAAAAAAGAGFGSSPNTGTTATLVPGSRVMYKES
jgi:cytoskeletal protein CcmA (bactofilin family)